MKCKQSNHVSILAQKPVFKKTPVNSERVTQESYIKLISWVALHTERGTTGTRIKFSLTLEKGLKKKKIPHALCNTQITNFIFYLFFQLTENEFYLCLMFRVPLDLSKPLSRFSVPLSKIPNLNF